MSKVKIELDDERVAEVSLEDGGVILKGEDYVYISLTHEQWCFLVTHADAALSVAGWYDEEEGEWEEEDE